MASLITKKIVDIGEIGNASTGDILYDGGAKINDNFTALFNTFGDKRLAETNNGSGLQVLHATGYFQRGNSADFSSPIPNGSQYDVDTSAGATSIRLAKGKRGELVRFINSSGSISINNPLLIIPNDSFKGISGQLRITSPYTIVTCYCVSDDNGISVWDYSIESMFGDTVATIRKTVELSTVSTPIPICHKSEFNAIKLMMTAMTTNGQKMKSSEVNILIDAVNNKVYNTEFASIIVGNTSEDDEIYDCDFTIGTNGFVNANVKSSTAGMKLAIKTTHTQKIGVAE
ncbi:hypothetical protein [Erwinia phage FBB1]|nr:hypothetical protein [Erwinia phage FBB1]